MKQPDWSSFIQVMVKEVDVLTKAGVWELWNRSEIGVCTFSKCNLEFEAKVGP
jgi:hypothetical protein